jgi:hypothetical protein
MGYCLDGTAKKVQFHSHQDVCVFALAWMFNLPFVQSCSVF